MGNGKDNTITIVETESGNVFGVYMNIAIEWDKSSHSKWFHDKNAFCFLIRSSEQYPPNIFEHNYNHDGKNAFTKQEYPGYLCLQGAIMIKYGGKGTVTSQSSFNHPKGYHLNGDE